MSGFLDVCFSNIKLSINPAMSGVNAIFLRGGWMFLLVSAYTAEILLFNKT